MRIAFVALVAGLGFSVSACASAPRHAAAADEVPMYSNAEWAQMNSDRSIPEIPADEVASNDVAPTTSFRDRSSGSMVYGALDGYAYAPSAFSNTGGITPSVGRATIFAGSSSFGHLSGLGHASVGGGHSSGGHGGGHGGR